MAKHKESVYIECPFFKWWDGSVICCMGVEKNSNLHLTFASSTKRDQYMRQNCYFGFGKCVVAKMLREKYDGKL